MRAMSPGSVLARCASRPIWRLRVEKTDSMTRRNLGRRALGDPVLGGRDELDVDQLHRGEVLAAPEAAVGNQRAARVCGGELEDRVALLAGLGAGRGHSRRGRPW